MDELGDAAGYPLQAKTLPFMYSSCCTFQINFMSVVQ